eukprot:361012-Chlamydomonas_euryale.AAC.2
MGTPADSMSASRALQLLFPTPWRLPPPPDLRVPVLVAHVQHGHACGQHERRREVPHLALAQPLDVPVVGCALRAAVPAEVVRLAIVVVLTVGLRAFASKRGDRDGSRAGPAGR